MWFLAILLISGYRQDQQNVFDDDEHQTEENDQNEEVQHGTEENDQNEKDQHAYDQNEEDQHGTEENDQNEKDQHGTEENHQNEEYQQLSSVITPIITWVTETYQPTYTYMGSSNVQTHHIYTHTQMPLMAETMVIPAGDLDAPKQKQICYFWSGHLRLCAKNCYRVELIFKK